MHCFLARPSRLFLILFATAFHFSLGAQELAPDDPSLAGKLGAWFRDAAANFDTGTGIWADASGNGRHAVPVGEVNVNGPITYLAPTPATISGGAFSAEDLPSVHFASDAEDLLQVADINGDTPMTELTIFVVYNVDPLGSNTSLARPVGIGSVAAIQFNNGYNYNLGSDPSIRKDNGSVGAGSYSAAFPNQTTFIRSSRMSGSGIDEWFNIDGTPQKVLTQPGSSSYPTSTDDFFLGDLRAGVAPIPGVAGGGTSPAAFDIVQTLVYTGALSDDEIAGVNAWLVGHITGGVGDAGLAFTGVRLGSDQLTTALTWRSRPGKIYAVEFTTDLSAAWQEITDGVISGGAETSFDAPNPVPAEGRVFFRVREISQR